MADQHPEVECSTSADDTEIARLSAMSPLAYERERVVAAERLGVRVGMLDRLVQAQHPPENCADQERQLTLAEPVLWPDPVDGAEVVFGLAEIIRRHVVVEEGADVAIALWVLHAHALDAFAISPRLAITSAEKRSGKTTLLDMLGCLVPRALTTANATPAAIFRTIEELKPTLLIDEADTFLHRNDELRGVLNSGHRRATAKVLRLEGDDHSPRQFGTWAATAIAMIGRLPDTLADRSLEIRMRRRLPHEPVVRFRSDRAADLHVLAQRAARWARDNLEALRHADPTIPAGVHDRMADNWGPLLAIADRAGGQWPERATQALSRAATQAEDADGGSIREMLLSDIRLLFVELDDPQKRFHTGISDELIDRDRIGSHDLAGRLAHHLEGRPWTEWGPTRRPISTHALARLLKPFNIAPTTHRFQYKAKDGTVTSRTEKGYLRSQFADAFARYLPPLSPPTKP